MKAGDEMNQFEVINNIIDYYKNLQAIKRANTCENKVLDYEIKTTKVKLRSHMTERGLDAVCEVMERYEKMRRVCVSFFDGK